MTDHLNAGLHARAAASCRWDLVSLGEVMLRLDPGDLRVTSTRQFAVWEGGGEYNVARGLRRVFGLRTAIATAFVDNAVGHLLEDLIRQGGVDQSYVRWLPFDGIGRAARNPLNFTERGFGPRAAAGCYDRGHSATSLLCPGDIDWARVFETDGTRWFHTGGIFAGLSGSTATVAQEALILAREHGTITSLDLNFRSSLWAHHGGTEAAQALNGELVTLVDLVVGNEEDYTAALGFEVEGADASFSALDVDAYIRMLEAVLRAYPNLRAAAATLRVATSASRNGWGAVCVTRDDAGVVPVREIEIFDRVGGGDSFASGLIYGLLAGLGTQRATEIGAAHGMLAMTTPGDTSMVSLAEVERAAWSPTARIVR
ncbi:MAG: sugar kinase [Solirubrobacteraceae bacterium]